MGPLSVENSVVNEDSLVAITKSNKPFLVVGGRVDHGNKGRMGNGHEPTVEATTLDISKTLLHAGWAGERGCLGNSDTCS